MRVGRGQGPKGPKGSGKAGAAKGGGGAKFKAAVDAVRSVDRADAVDPDEKRSSTVDAFQAIAEELASGELKDRRAAIHAAVRAVIKERFKGLKGRGVASLEEQVADLIDRDPRMASQLADQFRQLAERGKK